jgi:integrase/recombinase XerC
VDVRPRFEGAEPAAVWPTERGGRISTRSVDDRFALYRAAAGLPVELSVHCLRHSYVICTASTPVRDVSSAG